MNNEYKLTEGICNLSQTKTWVDAKYEWDLDSIYHESNPETCLCSHYPIYEICVLRNRKNGNLAIVGNVCVNKFIGLSTDKMFRSVKKVKKNNVESFDKSVIDFAFEKSWISEWEKKFYLNVIFNKYLSENQAIKKLQINQKVLLKIIDAKATST